MKTGYKVLTICLCAVFLLSAFHIYTELGAYSDIISQDDIDKMEAELEDIRKKQEENEKALAEILNEQSYTESAINYSMSLIDGYTEYCTLLSEIIAKYDDEIEATEKLIGEKQIEYDHCYTTYLNRLQASKEEENITFLELIVKSDSLIDLLNSVERANDAIKFDRELMDDLLNQQEELEKELAELERVKEGQQEQINGFEELKQSISDRVDELNGYLDELRDNQASKEEQKSLYERMEDEANEAIEALIQAYIKQQNSSAQYAVGETMRWPLNSKWTYISSPYGYRTHPVTGQKYSFHRGIDIPASAGENIYAALSGVVITSTYNSSYGYYIIIDHGIFGNTGKHLYSLYAHSSKLVAKKGQKVNQGDVIAKVGTTGSSTGNHLHFELRLDSSTVNPLEYVDIP